MERTSYGLLVIRIGLAGVLLWFGAQQLVDSVNWIGYVPEYATALSGFDARAIVFANGSVEIVSGLLLLVGFLTRIVAFVMFVHLATIALSLGVNELGVRDWGLAAAFLGLVFTGGGALALDKES